MTLNVTDADYRTEAAADVPEEFRLKPGRHKFTRTRTIARPEELKPRNTKVRITINIDLDIVDYFKKRAEAHNAAPYQTQINNVLREHIEKSEGTAGRLVENEDFMTALVDRLERRFVSRLRS